MCCCWDSLQRGGGSTSLSATESAIQANFGAAGVRKNPTSIALSALLIYGLPARSSVRRDSDNAARDRSYKSGVRLLLHGILGEQPSLVFGRCGLIGHASSLVRESVANCCSDRDLATSYGINRRVALRP